MLKWYLNKIYRDAAHFSLENIDKLLSQALKGGAILDVGCWDGEITKRWEATTQATQTHGIEIVPEAIKLAKRKQIKVLKVDVDKQKWPYKNSYFDCVVSNLVIEHMTNADHFISESSRVLKRGGVTIVSTNNMASWHNIFSLLFGFAPFDLTNTSIKRWSIGNPMAIHRNEKRQYGDTFTHKCIYTERWLRGWYELYGFKHVKSLGAGYFPLPAVFGRYDKLHCALITLCFVKK